MLRRLGVAMVLVGHSERRELYAMTDEVVAATAKAAISGGLTAVICVGETEEQREVGETEMVLTSQVTAALGGVAKGSESSMVLAYEPIWAIGTGNAATEQDAQAACAHIRAVVEAERGAEVAAGVRILYGGSAKPDNAAELMALSDVDGLLVGGASLDAESFAAIVDAAAACYGSSAGN
jgi:triosephosphate isomerase